MSEEQQSVEMIENPAEQAQQQQPPAGPRVTVEKMLAKIADVKYAIVEENKLTVAVVRMINGYVVLGKSAPVDPANFEKELGEKYALEDALNSLWPLEGYLLQEDLYRAALYQQQQMAAAAAAAEAAPATPAH